MKKIGMSTNWLPIIQPGTYETNLGYLLNEVLEEYINDFETQLCLEAQSIMNEIFNEDWFVDEFGNVTVSNCELKSPQYYNYENDSIEFDLEFNEGKIFDYWDTFDTQDRINFFEWTRKNYGSYDGFISSFPYTKKEFYNALATEQSNNKYEMAIAMLLMFAIHKSNCALDSYQHDFENNMEEYCAYNGLLYEEDEE